MGSDEKSKAPPGHFEAEVGDDLIRAALESVERHTAKATAAEVPVAIESVEPPAEGGEKEAGEGPSVEQLEKELGEARATLELSAQRARETLERLKETHERQLRAVADLDNYKKRAAREREEAEKFAVSKLVKELLPVLDNLDRAIEHAGAAEGGLAQGVVATRRLFEDTLAKFGVKGFSAKGQPFDPSRHEALQQLATADVPPGHVAQEIARGYLLHERLLRPAMVAVAVAPPAASAGETGKNEGGETVQAETPGEKTA